LSGRLVRGRLRQHARWRRLPGAAPTGPGQRSARLSPDLRRNRAGSVPAAGRGSTRQQRRCGSAGRACSIRCGGAAIGDDGSAGARARARRRVRASARVGPRHDARASARGCERRGDARVPLSRAGPKPPALPPSPAARARGCTRGRTPAQASIVRADAAIRRGVRGCVGFAAAGGTCTGTHASGARGSARTCARGAGAAGTGAAAGAATVAGGATTATTAACRHDGAVAVIAASDIKTATGCCQGQHHGTTGRALGCRHAPHQACRVPREMLAEAVQLPFRLTRAGLRPGRRRARAGPRAAPGWNPTEQFPR